MERNDDARNPVCAGCGRSVEAQWTYCAACGARLDGTARPATLTVAAVLAVLYALPVYPMHLLDPAYRRAAGLSEVVVLAVLVPLWFVTWIALFRGARWARTAMVVYVAVFAANQLLDFVLRSHAVQPLEVAVLVLFPACLLWLVNRPSWKAWYARSAHVAPRPA